MSFEWAMISAGCAAGGFAIAFATFWMTFGSRLSKAEADATTAKASAYEAGERIITLGASFSLYREQVAREYIHREAMREVEDRLTQAIDRLGDRLDRLFVEAAARK